MKRLILLALLAVFATAVNAQSKVATINIKSGFNCDHCKKCESCGQRIENALYAIKGIKRVDIDQKEKTLKVAYNTQKTTVDEIKKTITQIGFDADDMKADPVAYEKLDDCCKKAGASMK
jgi:copper chaperone CopZ